MMQNPFVMSIMKQTESKLLTQNFWIM